MNDFNALTTWVQPQHLATSAIDGYRADFESRTVHMLHITDFLKADKVTRLARFFGQEATFNQIYGLYATDGGIKGKRVSADGWRAADKGSRWYTYGLLADPDPRFRFSPNLITCLDLYRVLVTSAFRAYVSALTGLPLGDFLNHVAMQMRPGDFLGPHSDDGEGRRLAIVFYLSPAWKADYGGVLHTSLGRMTNISRSRPPSTASSCLM